MRSDFENRGEELKNITESMFHAWIWRAAATIRLNARFYDYIYIGMEKRYFPENKTVEEIKIEVKEKLISLGLQEDIEIEFFNVECK